MSEKMDKECCNNGQKSNKQVNRTEFAQEYSLETGKQCEKKSGKMNKTTKTNKH